MVPDLDWQGWGGQPTRTPQKTKKEKDIKEFTRVLLEAAHYASDGHLIMMNRSKESFLRATRKTINTRDFIITCFSLLVLRFLFLWLSVSLLYC